MRTIATLLFLLATLFTTPLFAQCTAAGDPAVAICMPANGATNLYSPLHLQIGTTDTSAHVDLLQVYYNYVKRWEERAATADFFLATGNFGPYRITALAHDASGRWFSSTINVSVTGQIFICSGDQVPSPAPPHTVFLCQPTDGEIHYSPVHVSWFATPATGHSLQAVQIFVDGVSMLKTPPATRGGYSLPEVDLPMSLGRHRITVQAYDGTTPYKSTIYITVPKVYVGCAPPATLPGVNLCSLTDGQTVTDTALIKASAAANVGIEQMQIWVDGVRQYTSFHAWLDQGLTLPSGPHTIEIRAIDYLKNTLSKTVNITVQ
jgi:hypothetical protein